MPELRARLLLLLGLEEGEPGCPPAGDADALLLLVAPLAHPIALQGPVRWRRAPPPTPRAARRTGREPGTWHIPSRSQGSRDGHTRCARPAAPPPAPSTPPGALRWRGQGAGAGGGGEGVMHYVGDEILSRLRAAPVGATPPNARTAAIFDHASRATVRPPLPALPPPTK